MSGAILRSHASKRAQHAGRSAGPPLSSAAAQSDFALSIELGPIQIQVRSPPQLDPLLLCFSQLARLRHLVYQPVRVRQSLGRTSQCWSGCRGRVALQCAAQAPPHPATLTCRACRWQLCLVVDHRAASGAGGSGWRWTGGRPAPPAAARSSLMTALQPARGCTRRRSSGRRHTPREGERRSPHCEQQRRDLWMSMRGRGHWVRCLVSGGVRLSTVCQLHSLLCSR